MTMKISQRYFVPAGPIRAARLSGNNSANGPTKISPETAKANAAASRPPETTTGGAEPDRAKSHK